MDTGHKAWREVSLVAVVMIVVAIIVAVGLIAVLGVTLSSIQGAQASKHSTHQPAGSGGGGVSTTSGPASDVHHHRPPIQLAVAARSVAVNEVLRLTGRYPTSHDPQDVHVQLRQHHRWITFPLEAVATAPGHFKAFVELAHRGPNRLRVIDRSNGRVSNVVTVTVR